MIRDLIPALKYKQMRIYFRKIYYESFFFCQLCVIELNINCHRKIM